MLFDKLLLNYEWTMTYRAIQGLFSDIFIILVWKSSSLTVLLLFFLQMSLQTFLSAKSIWFWLLLVSLKKKWPKKLRISRSPPKHQLSIISSINSLSSCAIKKEKNFLRCVLKDSFLVPLLNFFLLPWLQKLPVARSWKARSCVRTLFWARTLFQVSPALPLKNRFKKDAGLQKKNKSKNHRITTTLLQIVATPKVHENTHNDFTIKTTTWWWKPTILKMRKKQQQCYYTLHTHTHTHILLYDEYIQLWLWRNDQLLKIMRKKWQKNSAYFIAYIAKN